MRRLGYGEAAKSCIPDLGKKKKRKGFGLRKESRSAAFITVSYITLLNESVEKSELSDR